MDLKKIFRIWDRKESMVMRVINSLYTPGQPIWGKRDYATLAREGYNANAYVYACINQVASAVGSIQWVLYADRRKKREIEQHELLDLLARPNPYMSGSKLVENTIGFLKISGQGYIEANTDKNGKPLELFCLRPDRMKPLAGNGQVPVVGYRYTVGGVYHDFTPEQILHLKEFNPTDDFEGLAPLEVAGRSVDSINEAKKHNVAMFQNGARPTGALSAQTWLTDQQYEKLKNEIKENYQGAANAGRPLLLEGAMTWHEMGLSQKDMDWLQGQLLSAREICIVYGVPPQMLGLPDSQTYSNYQEARRAFYMETVLPTMRWLRDELNNWLVPKFDKRLYLDFDLDAIDALQDDRNIKAKRNCDLVDRGIISRNEARMDMGWDKATVAGMDDYLIPATLSPISASDTSDLDTGDLRDTEDQNQ